MGKMIISFVALILSCGFALAQVQYKVLWSFGASPNDGVYPLGSLVADRAGNFYGTTQGGGSGPGVGGTVFKLSPNSDGSWTETVLYSFCPEYPQLCVDGLNPQAGLVFDSAGNLYGTTNAGGSSELCGNGPGCGTVFELSPSPGGIWSETVLHSFCSDYVNGQCRDGFFPTSQLILDGSGNLYGTAGGGGSGHASGGTVFKLSRGAEGWTETVLYNFCSLGTGNFCSDGAQPKAGVTFDKFGNLYGTTEFGGSPNSQGGGTEYKLSLGPSGWTETVLKAGSMFGSGTPLGTVSLDPLGNLYTTFSAGGETGAGGVLRLGPGGGSTEFSFNGVDGEQPAAGVLLDFKHNALYGTTEIGGTGQGNVYQIVPPAQETVLYNFCSQPNCTDGLGPFASLIEDQSGNLYGTTKFGGANNLGVVFEIVQSFSERKASKQRPRWHTILPTGK